MKKESVLYGIIGLLLGAMIAVVTATTAVNNNNQNMMQMMGMHSNHQDMMNDGDMSMSDMTEVLKGKTGDDFDKAFLSEMIVHHQGAIDMAKLAKQNAKHDEIKKLADAILSAQSQEIDKMQGWQTDWGYKKTASIESSDSMHMMH